jgi:hypothetical protein
MIYNLVQYLRNELPGERIYADLVDRVFPDTQVPDRMINVIENGGSETAWFQFQDRAIQIMVRDVDLVNARELAYDVHEKINNKFGLELPAVNVGGEVYAAFQVAQISANSLPQSIGFDDNGRVRFSTNYRFLMTEG